MEPTLAVIGLNFRTSPVAVRERFWISESRRLQALQHLVRAEGIDEIVILPTCSRTEFIVWASDAPTAANSVLRFLTREYDLKLCEWSHFYRLLDDLALTHIFRVASSLDSMVIGEPDIAGQVRDAWETARKVRCTGRFLDAVMQKALAVSERVRTETAVSGPAVSAASASVEMARGVFGDLSGRKVLVIGAGRMSEMAAGYLLRAGAGPFKVMSRTSARAEALARKLGAQPVAIQDRLEHLKSADIVISSTACPHYIVSRPDAVATARARQHRPMVMIDIAVPRDIDPAVREVEGIHLFDLDDLEHKVSRNAGEQITVAQGAEKIILEELHGFRRKLIAERVVPTIVALRHRLEELCREELDVLRKEFGPFTEDQDEAMIALTSHISQRISGALAREFKQVPEKSDQEMLASALHRLFKLEQTGAVPAGTKN